MQGMCRWDCPCDGYHGSDGDDRELACEEHVPGAEESFSKVINEQFEGNVDFHQHGEQLVIEYANHRAYIILPHSAIRIQLRDNFEDRRYMALIGWKGEGSRYNSW
jgi:hypothetical protein